MYKRKEKEKEEKRRELNNNVEHAQANTA